MDNQMLLLLALLCMRLPYVWKAQSLTPNLFIIGIPTPSGVITYQCGCEYWSLFKVPVLPPMEEKLQSTADAIKMLDNYIASSDVQLINSTNLEQIENVVKQEVLPLCKDDAMAQAAYIGFYNK